MRSLVCFFILCPALMYAADEISVADLGAKLWSIDVAVDYVVDGNNDKKTTVVRRYILKKPRAARIGSREFLLGDGTLREQAQIDGSVWDQIAIPIDHIVAMGAVENIRGLISVTPAKLGVDVGTNK